MYSNIYIYKCDGIWVTFSVHNPLYKSILHFEVSSKISKKLNITTSQLQTIINWEVVGNAIKKHLLQIQKILILWINVVVPTGVGM